MGCFGSRKDSSGSTAGGVRDPIWISYIEIYPDAMRGIENLFEPVMAASEAETVPPQFRLQI